MVSGSRLTGGTAFSPWVRHFILCLVLVQPRKTENPPDITEKMLAHRYKQQTNIYNAILRLLKFKFEQIKLLNKNFRIFHPYDWVLIKYI